MDQIKLAGALSNDVPTDTESRVTGAQIANEMRTLDDLELMIAGGGDGITVW